MNSVVPQADAVDLRTEMRDLKALVESQKNEILKLNERVNVQENKLVNVMEVAEKNRKDLWLRKRADITKEAIFPCKASRN